MGRMNHPSGPGTTSSEHDDDKTPISFRARRRFDRRGRDRFSLRCPVLWPDAVRESIRVLVCAVGTVYLAHQKLITGQEALGALAVVAGGAAIAAALRPRKKSD